VHSPGLALLLWLVGAVIAACGLAVSLEFGTMLPRSGGDKVYLEFVYRRPRFLASTLIAVHAVLLGFTASNCIVFSRYVLFAFGWEDTAGSLAKKAVAVGLLCAITVLHVVFPRAGVRLQDGLGWIKIGLVMFMILSGMYAILVMQPSESYPGARSQLAWDGLWEGSVWNWGIVSTSLFKVFYSYAGLDNVNNVLNEVKNPVRTVRSVTLTALATACGMYLLVNVAYMLVVPLEEIRGSGELIAALFFERVFGVRLGRRILPLAVATSAAGNVLVVAFAMVSLASLDI
jgi:amino acid transporter